jgi:hypothetical protein
MEVIRRFFREHWLVIGLVIAFSLGAFLRWYHLGEWLHFEIDQSRDTKVIEKAIDGNLGDLPLLGPRAGGTILRLGPGFYYLEYVSALVFGMTPEGVAWLQSILSVAAIGLFFLFARRIFARGIALGLTLLFAVSPFLVVYGRFAWNPNPLPFFLLGGFLALLYSLDEGRFRAQWFVAASFLLSFATHLHFVAFLALPCIVAVFLLIRKPKFSWGVWSVAIVVALLFYVPVALNEWATGGANAQQFLLAISSKPNKGQHNLAENTFRMISNSGELSWMIVSGYERNVWPSLNVPTLTTPDIVCKESCRQAWLATIVSMIILFGGGAAFLWRLFAERDPIRANALFLTFLWFGACLALFIPLAYNFSPRFFLLVAPMPFLLLGFLLEFFLRGLPSFRWRAALLVIVVVALSASDLYFMSHRFLAWATAGSDPKENSFTYRLDQSDQILQEKAHITLEEQRAIIAWMASIHRSNGWPVYYFGEPEYRRSLRYIMDYEQKLPGDVTQFSKNDTYIQGNYFLVVRTNDNALRKSQTYQVRNFLVDQKSFGTLTVFRFEPRPGTTAAEAAPVADPNADQDVVIVPPKPGEPVRYTGASPCLALSYQLRSNW